MVKNYIKKPVVVEAIQWNGDNIEQIHSFMSPIEPVYMSGFKNSDEIIGIKTLEGLMVANLWDYIIKGIQGEFYPCKPDIFEKTYEEVI